MALKDWEDVAPEPLTVSITGTVYTVPAPSVAVGLRLTAFETDAHAAEGMTGADLVPLFLGQELFDRLAADAVPLAAATRLAWAAYADFRFGRAAAEAVWEGRSTVPESPASEQEASGPATKPRTRTAAANTTRSPASGTGTTSRPGRSRATTVAASPGPTSSPSSG